MRYQQPIYIQNESSGVRNKDILNVNMSSDLCIFQAPVFSVSGASKIDCECGCTGGYTLLETGICQYVDTISATSYGTFYTAHTGNTSAVYSSSGTSFYASELNGNIPYLLLTGVTNTSGYVTDNTSGVTINPDKVVSGGTLWYSNGSALNGRLNKTGVWATTGSTGTPLYQWIGFSKCINIDTTGKYSVGIAGDNRVKFSVNSELFYHGNQPATGSFTFWRVFELTLSAGTNVIELQGYNDGSIASFGAEIYNVGISGLTGMTTTSELDAVTIFTTKDYRYEETGIPLEFDLGESSGYSCPAGYFLNTCGTGHTCGILVESGCTVPTGDYFIVDQTTATTIPLTFEFTANTDSFTANSATFKYEIFKYNPDFDLFATPYVYKSDDIQYSAISATTSITELVPISALTLDGQYLVKGSYDLDVCTEYLNKLGKRIDTSYIYGSQYDLYNNDLDFYFTAINKAETPQLLGDVSNTPPAKSLFQQVITPEVGQTELTITNNYSGFFILTLNGLVLAPNYDYTYTGNVITLTASTALNDIITVTYTTYGSDTLIGDNIDISSTITSGTTNNEGSNSVYFNTTTGKYEIYTSITPGDGSILVMINGVTLANNIDYYQSTTNKKRIILEGDLIVGDLITIVYFSVTSVVNNIYVSNPSVTWSVKNAPQLANGYFSLEVSTGSTFNTMYYSGNTEYVVNDSIYSDSFSVSGTVGTKLYYRVKNTKNYETLCGSIISSTAYSDTLPITIQSNSINSY